MKMKRNPDLKDIYQESVAFALTNTRYNKEGHVLLDPEDKADDAAYEAEYQQYLKEQQQSKKVP